MRSWFVLGVLGGLVALVRWQNILLPLLSLPWKTWRHPWRRDLPLKLSAYGLGFLIAFSPQLLAWHAVYGEWVVTPQGDFMHWTKPYAIDVLFSPRYGLLGFSPILYVSVIGLAIRISSAREPLIGLAMSYLIVCVYVNASAGDWYGGATFGPRRMDSLFPFLVIGAAHFARWFREVIARRPQRVLQGLVAASLLVTLVLGSAYRTARINVGMDGAHEFPIRAWSVMLETVGWLPSLPAELYHSWRDGTRIGQYSALAHDDPVTWLDGVITPDERRLTRDWKMNGSTAILESDTGTIFLYLMDLGFHYRDIELDIVFSGTMSEPVRINDQPFVGTLGRTADRKRRSITVPYAVWRPGLNRMTLSGRGVELVEVVLRRGNAVQGDE